MSNLFKKKKLVRDVLINIIIQNENLKTISFRSASGTVPYPSNLNHFTELANMMNPVENNIKRNIISVTYISEPYKK